MSKEKLEGQKYLILEDKYSFPIKYSDLFNKVSQEKNLSRKINIFWIDKNKFFIAFLNFIMYSISFLFT